MRKSHRINYFLCFLLLTGCSQIPNANKNYYLPLQQTQIQIISSIACDSTNKLFVAYSVSSITTFLPDLDGGMQSIDLSALNGPFSDSDIKFMLSDDMRLKSVNATSTGQLENTIKSVASVVATAIPFVGAFTPEAPKTTCTIIGQLNNSEDKSKNIAPDPSKPITITYKLQDPILITSDGSNPKKPIFTPSTPTFIPADATSLLYANMLNGLSPQVPTLKLTSASLKMLARGVEMKAGETNSGPSIPVNDVAGMDIAIEENANHTKIWSSRIIAAVQGSSYKIPIPAPALFGQQNVSLVVNDTGILTSVEYGKTAGAASAANSVNDILSIPGSIQTQETAKAKSDGDAIAATQRLVKCEARPAACT